MQIIASGTEFSVGEANRDWQVWDVNRGNFKMHTEFRA